MHRERVIPVAMQIREALRPACHKTAIAGSLRRGREEVKDMEIVVCPVYDAAEDLFGQSAQAATYAQLAERLAGLHGAGLLAWDTRVKRNGNRYKRFVLPTLDGLALDLFLTEPDNWGNILAIRTGPAEWSTALVTQRRKRGLMPDNLRQRDGFLERLIGRDQWQRVFCPTEADFFAALGLPFVPAEERDESGLQRLHEIVRRGERR